MAIGIFTRRVTQQTRRTKVRTGIRKKAIMMFDKSYPPTLGCKG
jgi:hypothetical protein